MVEQAWWDEKIRGPKHSLIADRLTESEYICLRQKAVYEYQARLSRYSWHQSPNEAVPEVNRKKRKCEKQEQM